MRDLYFRAMYQDSFYKTAAHQVINNFGILSDYLKSAIEALQKREISVQFEIVHEVDKLYLNPMQYAYELVFSNKIRVTGKKSGINIQNGHELIENGFDPTKEQQFIAIPNGMVSIPSGSMTYSEQSGVIAISDSILEEITNLFYDSIECEFVVGQTDMDFAKLTQLDKTFMVENVEEENNEIIIEFIGNYVEDLPITFNEREYLPDEVTVEYSQNMNMIDENSFLLDKKPGNILKLKRDHKNRKVIFSAPDFKQILIHIKDKAVGAIYCESQPGNYVDSEGLTYQLSRFDERYFISNKSLDDGSIITDTSGMKYKVEVILKDTNNLRIKIKDEEEHGELMGKTAIDYVFDDEVSSLMGRKTYYDSKNDDLVFFIERKNIKERTITFKGNPKFLERKLEKLSVLYTSINPHNLKLQKRAIDHLIFTPYEAQKSLVDLGLHRELKTWTNPSNPSIKDWFVLDNPEIEAVETQKAFVRKALGTKEFAFLEGPPGSGKTTSILELILQLIREGKRIMLVASTHVAVDNILERLQDEFKDLIKNGTIRPLRFGETYKISDHIGHFGEDMLMKDGFEDLILDSVNIVCGTSYGILRHPKFKEGRNQTFSPIYDYIIMDEVSKTTLTEFLVPALYARRWILVGDIKQLAPFAESSYLAGHLQDQASRYLNSYEIDAMYVMFALYKNYKINKMVIIVEDKTMKQIIKSFKDVNKSTFISKSSSIIPDSQATFIQGVIPEVIMSITSKYVFIERSKVNKNGKSFTDDVLGWLPIGYTMINLKSWKIHPYTYRSMSIMRHLSDYENELDKITKANELLENKTWSEEISWRVIRSFELKNVTTSVTQRYKSEIDELITHKEHTETLKRIIDDAYRYSLPSVLELLQAGITDDLNSAILLRGIPESIISPRFETLKKQFRMHPQISEFPRKEFYVQDDALQDSDLVKTGRNWTYKRYKHRYTWINVWGRENNGVNWDEIEKIKTEVNKFISWASKQNKEYTVAILTYYRGQEWGLRKMLRELTGYKSSFSHFKIDGVKIMLHTVDKVQGKEADIVFLSMRRTSKMINKKRKGGILGFMDNPNRLNVAITRARYQLVVVGDILNFKEGEGAIQRFTNSNKQTVGSNVMSNKKQPRTKQQYSPSKKDMFGSDYKKQWEISNKKRANRTSRNNKEWRGKD